MLLGVARFELHQLLRRISTWVYFAAMLGIAFLVTLSRAGTWPDFDMGQAVLAANSPLRIATLTLIMGMLGVPIVAAVAGRAVFRDFETGSFPLFFTTPVPRAVYLGGRYLGSVAACAFIFLGVPLGVMLGAASGLGEPGRIVDFDPGGYLQAWLLLALPNLLFTAALFLMLAALTRRIVANYAGAFVLLVGWGIAMLFVDAVGEESLTWLMDPFAVVPTLRSVRYWTVVEQNSRYLPMPPLLLLNRLLWLSLGAAALVGGGSLFRFAQGGEEGRSSRVAPPAGPPPLPVRPPDARRDFGMRAHAMQFAAILRRSVREVVGSVWFVVIAGVCLLFVTVAAYDVGQVLGTRTFPVTYMVLESLSGMFGVFVLLMITVYAGELVWLERDRRAAGQMDAAPMRSWVPLLAKIAALTLVVALLLAMCAACGILLQLSRGYLNVELGQYARELLLHQLIGVYVPLVILSVTVHTLANQKYLGHFAVVLFYIAMGFAAGMGRQHNLWFYASAPTLQYSDMNGWGHAGGYWWWYALYWNGVAGLLSVMALLFWPRGLEGEVRWRLRGARSRLKGRVLGAGLALLALVLGTGGWIVYNTTMLNEYHSGSSSLDIQAGYERMYKRYQWIPQPRIVGVKLELDIYPERRDVWVRGEYRLRNRTRASVPVVHVDLPSDLALRRIGFAGATRVIADSARGYYAFRLARPLAPGDSAVFRFEVGMVRRGFTDEPEWGPVLGNGTFFNQDLLPRIGYNEDGEIYDPEERASRGLPPRPRAASIDDARYLRNNLLSADADWVDFEATISTSGDQIAMAPGYLQREWRQGGRRYFHYRMDAPILRFYSFQSGRYAVSRDRWRNVNIEVYYHPAHHYNVERMIQASRKSLEYYTRVFGPYQHRQVRIVEFPRYGDYAQSYPNTIPYSEGIGFIADVGADDIDYPFFVTAHEVAHQWWGHQLAGAAVQGSSMLSETLAEYSALMVMEREYGRRQIGRFLEHDLDAYLRGRFSETIAEQPLALVEHQPYIHYNKGGLAMYALRDYIGEERLNGALRAFLEEHRFRGPSYPTSRDLVRHLRAATPDSLRYIVDDLFERVTLWDLRATAGEYERLPSGAYRVTLDVESRKLWADGLGNEEEVAMSDWVDVGVYGVDTSQPLYLRKHRIGSGESRIVVEVRGRPHSAGVDPQHKLIDRRGGDNTIELVEAEN